HALTDALVGAAGLGDIGTLFPSDDRRFENADSIQLLNQALLKVVEAGFTFAYADVTVIAEAPKLAPHVERMSERLAEALLCAASHVSVKAKTNDRMGWIGEGKGMRRSRGRRSKSPRFPDRPPPFSRIPSRRPPLRLDHRACRGRKRLPPRPRRHRRRPGGVSRRPRRADRLGRIRAHLGRERRRRRGGVRPRAALRAGRFRRAAGAEAAVAGDPRPHRARVRAARDGGDFPVAAAARVAGGGGGAGGVATAEAERVEMEAPQAFRLEQFRDYLALEAGNSRHTVDN